MVYLCKMRIAPFLVILMALKECRRSPADGESAQEHSVYLLINVSLYYSTDH